MSSWNCQELGSPLTVRHLKYLIKRFKTIIVFLMEMKQDKAYVEYVNPAGINGGLALWWTREVRIHIQGKERNFIDNKVFNDLFGVNFLATWVYGDPDFSRRRQNWDTLKGLGASRREVWICMGDFNDITHHREKIGGRRNDQCKIDDFNDLIADLQVEDLGFKGQLHTWSNNRRGSKRVMERLDRVLGNRNWCSSFPKAQYINEWVIGSVHSPIVLELEYTDQRGRK